MAKDEEKENGIDTHLWKHWFDVNCIPLFVLFPDLLLPECEMPDRDVWQGCYHVAGKKSIKLCLKIQHTNYGQLILCLS